MAVVASRRVAMLYETAGQLRNFSEWSMGRDLVSRAVADPGALVLRRRGRTVLFMDIRGFTHWSERQSPEAVVAMLNAYFRASEQVWRTFPIVIARLIADEVFLVIDDTVTTGARFCSAAQAGEILVAEHVAAAGAGQARFGAVRYIEVKGKSAAVAARPLLAA